MLKQTPIEFHVERTVYGWSVKLGAEHLGLFLKQRQALIEVEKRRAKLKAKGRPTTVHVSGSEPEPISNPFRRW